MEEEWRAHTTPWSHSLVNEGKDWVLYQKRKV